MTTKPAYVDLHMHTEYSDGTCTPRELVKLAKWNGLDIIAVTDHDNFAGYEEAKRFGEMYGLWVVPGVEFTTPDYHLLGLNFNPKNSRIREFIEYSRERQKLRTGDRIKVLQEYGVPITIEKVEKVFPKARIGRLNIMEAMLIECSPWLKIKHGWNTPTEELFAYYFKKGGVAAEIKDRFSVSPEEVITNVHEAEGIVILAHPTIDVKSMDEIDKLKEIGLDGLEIQPNFYEFGYKAYEEYAMAHNLRITYGSDYHGPRLQKRLMLGRGINTLRKSEYESDRFESWLMGFSSPLNWSKEDIEAYAELGRG